MGNLELAWARNDADYNLRVEAEWEARQVDWVNQDSHVDCWLEACHGPDCNSHVDCWLEASGEILF